MRGSNGDCLWFIILIVILMCCCNKSDCNNDCGMTPPCCNN